MQDEKATIFDFETSMGVISPLGNWMLQREEKMVAERIKTVSVSKIHTPDPPVYQSGDTFVYNIERLFLIRNYQKNNQQILWSTPARSGNGKYLNKPEHQDKKYDGEIGGPIPSGWYYMLLNDFTADKTSIDKKVKKGAKYKGYEAERSGGPWGEWARAIWPSTSNWNPFWYGRDEFFLHEDGNEEKGGNAVGSGGCIACTKRDKGIKSVQEFVKKAYQLGDSYIYVHVNYEFKTPVQNILHTVLKDETLYSLSKKYGVSIEQIQKANGLKNTVIKTGEVLIIPISGCGAK